MIFRNFPAFSIVLVFLVINFESTLPVGAATPKSKSKSTKTKTTSAKRTSAHQYGSLTLKPSKPDPHFDILDEQRAYKYGDVLREGRSSTQRRSPTKLREATRFSSSTAAASIPSSISSLAGATRREKSKSNKSMFKEIPAHSSSSSVESTFEKKSSTMRQRNTLNRFLGSQLISGDAGTMGQTVKASPGEKNGWKILMGPSVPPEDEEESASTINDNNDTKRSYTSLTDGLGRHRTITHLRELTESKNRNPIAEYSVAYELPVSSSRRNSNDIGRRSMQVTIPKQTLKHKYATITRRMPSKTPGTTAKPSVKRAKKVQRSRNNPNLFDNSIDSNNKRDQQSYYTSPAMTLDTKKLIIEPLLSSDEPNTFMVGTPTSTEHVEGENENEQLNLVQPPEESHFNPLAVNLPHNDDIITLDDEFNNQFQTKTAFNPADYSLVSISTSLNHPVSVHRHHTEYGGPVISAPSSPSILPHHYSETGIPPMSGPGHEMQEPSFKNFVPPPPEGPGHGGPGHVHDSLPHPAEPVPANAYPIFHGPHFPVRGPGHHVPLFGPRPYPHHYPHPLPPPPPPPRQHLMHPGRRPIAPPPFEIGHARKVGGGSASENHKTPPPPLGIDPGHPVVQQALRNPHSLLSDGFFLEPQPQDSSNAPAATKKYLPNVQYQVHEGTLIPLDKRLVYLSMIFSWMFWITTFYTYYRYTAYGTKNKPFVLNVPKNGESPQVATSLRRSLDANDPWSFAKVLEYIEIAQKTYEGFDWQDLNCQKRTLCELVQKQNEPWGETGRKLANSYVNRIMTALDGIPMPQLIQTYLRQYREAILQGKTAKDCGQVYSECKFSIKDVLSKAVAKKKA